MRSDWPFWLFASLLVIARLFHFEPELDSPHFWRQADTAQYIWSFFHEGISLFHPSVAWMGGHKTVILEFPLPEAMVAILQKLLGEGLWVGRLFFLASFVGSAYFLFRIIQFFSSSTIAQWATILYLAMPLGIYFSRAIHIDFFELMLAHAMLWYYIRAVEAKSLGYWAITMAVGTLAILVKAPYAGLLGLPMLFFVLKHINRLWVLRNAWMALFPILCFVLWEMHRTHINGAAPDWYFIPDYRKFVDMSGWYFGDWYQRKAWGTYSLIGSRIFSEIMMLPGLVMVAGNWAFPARNPANRFAWIWLLAVVVYALVFINLNRIHNYYQIPFMAPLAWVMALGIEKWRHHLSNRFSSQWIVYLALIIFAYWGFRNAEQFYYTDSKNLVTIGNKMAEVLPPNDLIVCTYADFDPRAPHLLYQSHHYGWSIKRRSVSQELLQQLKGLGAKWWVFVGSEENSRPHLPAGAQLKGKYFAEETGHRFCVYEL